MSAVKRGARAGLAAFALGLSLAGPQAAGIAAADSTDADTSSAPAEQPSSANDTATPIRPSRPAQNDDSDITNPGRGRIAPEPAASTDADDPVLPEIVESRPARRVADRQERDARSDDSAPVAVAPRGGHTPTPATPAESDSNPVRPVVAAPAQAVAPAASAAPAVTAATLAPRPAASVVGLPAINEFFSSPPPALAKPVAEVTVAISGAISSFFDSTAKWVAGLPGGPMADLLEGALLLVRRTFSSMLPALYPGQATGQTDPAPDAYFTDAQMQDYLLGLAKQQYGNLFGTTVPVYGYGPYGPYPEYLKAQADGAGTGANSGTNTQVNGVDEADFVENDGNFIYTAHNGTLTITRTDLSVASQSMLSGDVVGEYLAGDTLTVLTQSGNGWYGPYVKMAYPGYWGPWNPQTTVTVYDVTDRTAPVVVKQTVFDGAYQDSRAVDGVVYVVTQRSVNLPAPKYTDVPIQYIDGGAAPAELSQEARIRFDPSAPVANRTYETWDEYVARVGDKIVDLSLPHAYRVDANGNTVDLGLLAAPKDIVRPHADNQQTVLTVASVDSRRGPAFSDSVATMVSANGGTVYMTPSTLYVATAEDHYTESGYSSDTRIDRFVVAGPKVSYQATGLVSGTLINQFAMDERNGYLRVATHTTSGQWGGGTSITRDDNGITVLDTAGTTLDQVGQLTGLAPGEQLYAVRYVGDTAYLVTFVRTDPLFAIDLSDPAAPALQGELVVPGFSNYLQSVGDGLLLGIGQEREDGSWNTHVHASLFDVRDGANLTQIEREFLDPGYQWSWSDAQFDHHALLYSEQDGLLVVPVTGSGYDPQTGYRYGQYLKVLRVSPTGIDVVGEIHPAEPTLRTVRIGDVLYAVGDTSVTAYRISDLSEIGRSTPVPSVV
ncbi:beta-propeller domain-containing protein [Mycolicibacterium sp.]|uniref:beta-propeller domain-containing protein n=1 Tax=Mycolicibacterium sp. TaxID=2320850 RepID=UPI0028AA3769|nr:beta-propeller domain-containing protein [Mycolicibacterium sp.]